ncbi:MAG: GxxExxY protein [Deltaproteobacteria bacterium]|nr:GxxExxY protein [Deltaproteobacteria bacterium]
MSLAHEALSHDIIGAAIEVHRTLGPGFVEAIYAGALGVELAQRRIDYQRELVVPIRFRGIQVGWHRLDLLIGGRIVVELKAVREFKDVHFAVMRSYLRAIGLEHGLLLNFAQPTLQVRRVIALRSGLGDPGSSPLRERLESARDGNSAGSATPVKE